MIYNHQEGKASIIKSTGKNDVDGGLPLYWIHTVNDRDIIMVIDSQYVLEKASELQQEKTQFNGKEKSLLDFASKLNTDDPLVMIKYHLK